MTLSGLARAQADFISRPSLWKVPRLKTASLGSEILESFAPTLAALEPSVQKDFLPFLNELTKERNSDFFLESLLQIGVRLKSEHQEIPARILLERLSQADIPPEIRKQAIQEHGAVVGDGSSMMRLEYLLSGLTGEGDSFLRGIAPVLGAGMIGRIAGTVFLGRLAGMAGSFWTRGVGASLASGTVAFLAEVPALAGLSWACSPEGAGAFGDNLLPSALGLGVMRGSSFLGRWAFSGLPFARTILPLGATFIGLYSLHKLEANYGMRKKVEDPTMAAYVLGSMATLWAGVGLGKGLLGRRWLAFEREIDLRADSRARRGRMKEDSTLTLQQTVVERPSTSMANGFLKSKELRESNLFAISSHKPKGEPGHHPYYEGVPIDLKKYSILDGKGNLDCPTLTRDTKRFDLFHFDRFGYLIFRNVRGWVRNTGLIFCSRLMIFDSTTGLAVDSHLPIFYDDLEVFRSDTQVLLQRLQKLGMSQEHSQGHLIFGTFVMKKVNGQYPGEMTGKVFRDLGWNLKSVIPADFDYDFNLETGEISPVLGNAE